MNAKDAAIKWGVTERRVREWCRTGMVVGAEVVSGEWRIPDACPRPVDSRSLRYMGIPAELKAEFVQVETLKAELARRRPLTEGELKALRENFLVEYTYHSNAIEGNTLTLSETAMVLQGITVGEKPLKDHLEAVGHRDAFAFLEEVVRGGEVISERLVKDIHYLVLGASPQDRGRYRRIPVVITGAAHVPPQPYLVETKMEEWTASLKATTLHPIVAAAKFHIDFEAIHPFIDGNGRTGRLLANFILMRSGFLPISIKYENRRAYYEAFNSFHQDNDGALAMIRLFLAAERARLEEYLHLF